MKFRLIIGTVLLALGLLPTLAQDSNLGALAGSWKLVAYGSVDAPVRVLEAAPITAVFSAEGVRGNAGCNTYFGSFTFDNAALKMLPLASTRKACEGAGVMEQESAYLSALQTATNFQVGGEKLLINYEGGLLTFAVDTSAIKSTAIPDTGDSSLGGLAGSWTLVSYGVAQAVLAEAPITATFTAQGVSGSAGCNEYNGNFSYNNGTLTVSSLVSTEKACTDAGVMEQETAYLEALAGAINYQLGGGQLLINYEGGVLTFAVDTTAIPTPNFDTSDPALGGLAGRWTLISYGTPEAPVAVLETAPVTAVVSPGGIGGNAGCNNYSGMFGYVNRTLTLGPLVSTLKACEEEGVMEQEAAYLTALQSATNYQVSGGQLLITYEGGVLTFAADINPTPIPDTGDTSLGGLAGSWTLVSYGGGQAVLADYPITADFTVQGVSGSASCNTYSGIFTYSNGTVTISDLVTTLKACSDQGVAEQEAAYLAALQTTGSYQVSGGQLIIGYEDGALVFDAVE